MTRSTRSSRARAAASQQDHALAAQERVKSEQMQQIQEQHVDNVGNTQQTWNAQQYPAGQTKRPLTQYQKDQNMKNLVDITERDIQKIKKLDEMIYNMESKYLQTSSAVGNIVTEYQELTKPMKSTDVRKLDPERRIRPQDRIFSQSSYKSQ